MRNSLTGVLAALAALGAAPAAADPGLAYKAGSLVESKIVYGPWNLHTHTAKVNYDASGIIPSTTTPPYSGTGLPYNNYCPSGAPATNPATSLMQPYYFPYVFNRNGWLFGMFDYRPRNEQEATVEAYSTDWGATWRFRNQSLGLNNYCPWDATDPDNQFVNVGGVKTAYGSDSTSAADNGQGHPTMLLVGGHYILYTLNRANGHIDSDPLVVHKLTPGPHGFTAGLPEMGFVSPLGSGGYPTLDSSALATTGLVDPDAIMGSVKFPGGVQAVVYVEKQLGADNSGSTALPSNEQCPSTPSFALTNLVNKKAKKPNHDITTVRIATTKDGLAFTDVGAASGLNDPTTVALNGIRWLGSGSLVPLSDGRYGMFFGAGNCLDNDSDGFHFMGYAETVNVVRTPADLQTWTVLNGLDNPILSTDTVTNPTGPRAYPLNTPLVSDKVDALTSAQVAPYVPPAGGYGQTFFSGRVYDPQVSVIDSSTLNVVFAGYNTPQPSSNLGDYRTIGRFQLTFAPNYFASTAK